MNQNASPVLKQIFARNRGLISEAEQCRLAQATVAIAGAGADGGLLAERLIRAGVGRLRLADPERFEPTNFNRQFGADLTTLGLNKAEAVAQLLKPINPKAEIEVFSRGVTEENVERFVAGANLVIDEIEYTRLDLSVLLHREARRQGKHVLIGVNVGWGANLFAFSPAGMSLEEYVGLPRDARPEEARWFTIPPEKFAPHLPAYWDEPLIDGIVQGSTPIPSISPSVALVAAMVSTAAIIYLAQGVEPVTVPGYTSIDLYTQKARFTRSTHRAEGP
jgi:molybdopterin/thiamine biosynthesis adenylyltransferase